MTLDRAWFTGEPQPEHYVLRLYVTGMTPRSQEAVARITSMCRQYLAGRYDLEVIDIYQHPELARDAQIVAIPTLVKELPPPVCRVIGDLLDSERLLMRLDVRRAA